MKLNLPQIETGVAKWIRPRVHQSFERSFQGSSGDALKRCPELRV